MELGPIAANAPCIVIVRYFLGEETYLEPCQAHGAEPDTWKGPEPPAGPTNDPQGLGKIALEIYHIQKGYA